MQPGGITMPEFLIILNAIVAVLAIGGAIGGVFFYLSRQVSKINQQSSEIATLQQQLEAEHKRVSRANQQIDLLTNWVNVNREATPQMGLEFGPQFEPIPNLDDN